MKQDRTERSRDGSHHERSHHRARSHDHGRSIGRRDRSRPRETVRNYDSSHRSEEVRHRSKERRDERYFNLMSWHLIHHTCICGEYINNFKACDQVFIYSQFLDQQFDLS